VVITGPVITVLTAGTVITGPVITVPTVTALITMAPA